MAAVNQAIVKCNQSFRALLISQPSNTATDSSAIWNAILSMTDGWITRFVSGSRSERSVYISVFLFSSPAEVFRKADELKALSLDVPPAVDLALKLRERNIDIPEGILTIDDMVDCLCR